MSQSKANTTMSYREPRFWLRVIGSVILAGGVAVTLLLALTHLRQVMIEKRSLEHLESFSKTLMMSIEPTRGHFPPAYVLDNDGRRVHSWRAYLLPFFDFDYGADGRIYKFDEPWDSPANTRFRNETPYYKHYSCPLGATGSQNVTYLCVVGGTLWPLPRIRDDLWKKPSSRSIREGGIVPIRGRAILLVDIFESDIPWTMPEDINLSELVSLLREDPTGNLFQRKIRHVVGVDAQGKLHIYKPKRDMEEIRAILDAENELKIE